MSIQYSSKFKIFRTLFKYFLSYVHPIYIKIFPLPKIASIEETIDRIIENKFSICRFGDGELLYISEKRNLPFQDQDIYLREKLIEILKFEHPHILVGLPIGYQDLSNLKKEVKITWKAIVVWTYLGIKPYINMNKYYYNASITRLYIGFENTEKSGSYFEKMRSIWHNRDILLIEGEKSRLGVGNDLFDNAKSVERLLAPSQNAFKVFDKILLEAKTKTVETLILVALGPTAKPVVFELAKLGYQALDIGNLDTEYEWYKMKAKSIVKIKGKYTSEAVGGRNVEDIFDIKYESEITKKILN